jgi:hypothetical protein
MPGWKLFIPRLGLLLLVPPPESRAHLDSLACCEAADGERPGLSYGTGVGLGYTAQVQSNSERPNSLFLKN